MDSRKTNFVLANFEKSFQGLIVFQFYAHINLSETVQERVMHQVFLSLLNSIYLRWWEVRNSVPVVCCIPSLEQDSQAPPQVVDSLTLILPSVPGKG